MGNPILDAEPLLKSINRAIERLATAGPNDSRDDLLGIIDEAYSILTEAVDPQSGRPLTSD